MVKHIFVLAGGIDTNGKVYPFVMKRLDKALSIYNNGDYIYCIGGGTYHKPPYLNKDNFVIHESTACAEYLHKHGIKESNILKDWSSYDTIANGFFSFTNYIIPLRLKEITVITSRFHMNRAKLIYDHMNYIFMLDIKIIYIETDNILEKDILSIRVEREENSCKLFKKNIITNYRTTEDFTLWLYTKHKSYKALLDYELKPSREVNKTY